MYVISNQGTVEGNSVIGVIGSETKFGDLAFLAMIWLTKDSGRLNMWNLLDFFLCDCKHQFICWKKYLYELFKK